MTEFRGLPGAANVEVSPEARRLRDRLLGPRHDDPRHVTLHWTGVEELAGQLARLPYPPRVDDLLDPQDYLIERAYRVAAKRWRRPMPGSTCAGR